MGDEERVAAADVTRHATIAERERLALRERYRRRTAPATLAQLRTAAKRTGLPPSPTAAGWAVQLDLWTDAERVSATFRAGIYTEDLRELVASAAAAAHRVGSRVSLLASREQRGARWRLQRHLRSGIRLRGRALLEAAEAAAAVQERWRPFAVPGAVPAAPPDLGELRVLHAGLVRRLAELERDGTAPTVEAPISDAPNGARSQRG